MRLSLRRIFLIGLCVLMLCSCRGPSRPCPDVAVAPQQQYPSLPGSAYTGAGPEGSCPTPCPPIGPPGMEQGVPLPYAAIPPWVPPGIACCPWPVDEYVCDGGQQGPVAVGRDWEVKGLEVEDTVAHYDTADGRTLVEPSNRVCLYSPRFGAVRQVVSLVANEQMSHSAGIYLPVKPLGQEERQPPLTTKQNIQPVGEIGARPAVALRSKQGYSVASGAVGPRGFHNGFKPYENLSVIRLGVFQESETAFLAKGVNAAVAWTHNQQVQVILDEKAAMADVSYEKVQALYTVKGEHAPQLRLIKVASTPFAQPGDEIDFTLRFDNVGDQVIGNVTIIDSLSARLEYILDSAQCSRDAQFSAQPNDADSLVLRWEINDPVEAGKGGVIRFRCRVR